MDSHKESPIIGIPLTHVNGPLGLPALIFGAGAFSNQYNDDAHIASDTPLQTVRLALQYGINAFDSSPYYGPSEIVLGNALKALESEYPRSSYQLITKCGRYGVDKFDYSPSTIRQSVARSLERFHTDHLDAVYLHDVEFVADKVLPRETGDHREALSNEIAQYGLGEGDGASIKGEGDQKVLDAFAELQKLKDEGKVKQIGLTGYPLPTLLRLALLILNNPPFKPVDILLSYSHICLQNSSFIDFVPHFYQRAKVGQLVAASPLSMGLLKPSPPPWHPAPEPLLKAVRRSIDTWQGDFPDLALGYSIRLSSGQDPKLPLVVGFSNPREVHECVRVWREIQNTSDRNERIEGEQASLAIFKESGYLDWSWASP